MTTRRDLALNLVVVLLLAGGLAGVERALALSAAASVMLGAALVPVVFLSVAWPHVPRGRRLVRALAHAAGAGALTAAAFIVLPVALNGALVVPVAEWTTATGAGALTAAALGSVVGAVILARRWRAGAPGAAFDADDDSEV